jgi:hypothetical protein
MHNQCRTDNVNEHATLHGEAMVVRDRRARAVSRMHRRLP